MTFLRILPLACVALSACLAPPPPLPEEGDASTGAQPDTSGPEPGTLGQTTDPSSSGQDPGSQSDSGTTDGDDDTTAGDESSTGQEPPVACCHGECAEACVDLDCRPVSLGGPSGSDAMGVAVVGDYIVWSTGWGNSLEVSGPEPGSGHQLASVFSNNAVSKITSDDTHVYFLDYNRGHVKRATVPQGAIDLVTEVPGPDPGAALGGIVVDDEHVYFAMQYTGGVWRAAKDLSQPEAELVHPAVHPGSVALDDTHVYWSEDDNGVHQVFRLALDDIGNPEVSPGLVYDGSEITALAADETGLYIGDAGALIRVDPLGTNQGIMDLATSQITVLGIALDEVHAYWTAYGADVVGRARKDGIGDPDTLASTSAPFGIALSCDRVYWASITDQGLYGMPK